MSGRPGAFFLAIAIGIVLFLAGNLVGFLGIFDFGRLVGLSSPMTRSASEISAEVTTRQLAARLDEAAAYLDGASLYRYTQEDLDAATEASMESLIEQSGDIYATYLTPEEFEAYNRTSEGVYAGIGIILTTIDGKPTVLEVYEGSSAYDLGVKAGDVVLAIDGDRRERTVADVVEAIQRPAGESVTIIWQRGTEEIETVLTLGAVNIPVVVSHLITSDDRKIGYVYLRRFNEQSSAELGEAVTALESQGAQGLILDLRGNPGGYLTQAVGITSLFVGEGDVLQIESRGSIRTEKVTGNTLTDKPLVVLINKSSASASELVAAALKDHGRATIVGETSYGKGTIQDLRKLSWGGALKYTIAHYLSPSGTPIDGAGVSPDVAVGQVQGDGVPGFTDNITSSNYIYSAGKDAQLDAALAEARAKIGKA